MGNYPSMQALGSCFPFGGGGGVNQIMSSCRSTNDKSRAYMFTSDEFNDSDGDGVASSVQEVPVTYNNIRDSDDECDDECDDEPDEKTHKLDIVRMRNTLRGEIQSKLDDWRETYRQKTTSSSLADSKENDTVRTLLSQFLPHRDRAESILYRQKHRHNVLAKANEEISELDKQLECVVSVDSEEMIDEMRERCRVGTASVNYYLNMVNTLCNTDDVLDMISRDDHKFNQSKTTSVNWMRRFTVELSDAEASNIRTYVRSECLRLRGKKEGNGASVKRD